MRPLVCRGSGLPQCVQLFRLFMGLLSAEGWGEIGGWILCMLKHLPGASL